MFFTLQHISILLLSHANITCCEMCADVKKTRTESRAEANTANSGSIHYGFYDTIGTRVLEH